MCLFDSITVIFFLNCIISFWYHGFKYTMPVGGLHMMSMLAFLWCFSKTIFCLCIYIYIYAMLFNIFCLPLLDVGTETAESTALNICFIAIS